MFSWMAQAQVNIGRRSRNGFRPGGERGEAGRLSRSSWGGRGVPEDRESWRGFLWHLKDRGADGACAVHFYRIVQRVTARSKIREVSLVLKAIHAQKDREPARRKAEDVAGKLRALGLEQGPHCRRRLYGDVDVLRFSFVVLEESAYQQSTGTPESGDQQQNTGSRQLSGRPCRAHAGERPAAVQAGS